jgi:hypothetical protein
MAVLVEQQHLCGKNYQQQLQSSQAAAVQLAVAKEGRKHRKEGSKEQQARAAWRLGSALRLAVQF